MCPVPRCPCLRTRFPSHPQKTRPMLDIANTAWQAMILEVTIVCSHDSLCLPRLFSLPLWCSCSYQPPSSCPRRPTSPPHPSYLKGKLSNVQYLLRLHDELWANVWQICAVAVLLGLEPQTFCVHQVRTREETASRPETLSRWLDCPVKRACTFW